MKQVTAKTLEEALLWIHAHEHFESGLEWANGKSRETGCFELGSETHRFFRNHFEKLRIKLDAPWARRFFNYLQPNPRQFDSRMYALTKAGKRHLYESAMGLEAKEKGV